MLDLKPEYQKIVTQQLAQYVPNMTVWAYGSRVNGKAHAGSDLDLVVINPDNPKQAQSNLSSLKNAFSESHLPISVDVLDWARIPPSFQQEINEHHEVVLF